MPRPSDPLDLDGAPGADEADAGERANAGERVEGGGGALGQRLWFLQVPDALLRRLALAEVIGPPLSRRGAGPSHSPSRGPAAARAALSRKPRA